MIKLGSLVKDNLTGFEGIATARMYHLHGCIHIFVQPTTLKDDGSPKAEAAFDEQRIELIDGNTQFVAEHEREPSIVLGSKVKDKQSGFTGIASNYVMQLFGSDRVCINSFTLDKDGVPQKELWVDFPAVEVISEQKPPVSEHASKPKQDGSMETTNYLGSNSPSHLVSSHAPSVDYK